MTFEIIKGDLFDPAHRFDALAQGVNCIGIMGAGIAVPFKTKFPHMYAEYQELCRSTERQILAGHAQMSSTDALHSAFSEDGGQLPDVINLFTQVMPGANADYALVESAAFSMDQTLRTVIRTQQLMDVMISSDVDLYYENTPYRVGLPWIGCGIGGLERHNVQTILTNTLQGSFIEYVLVEQ